MADQTPGPAPPPATKGGGRNFDPLPESDPFDTLQPIELAAENGPLLMVGTKKGAFFYTTNDRLNWTLEGPLFLGHIVHHIVMDPRDGRTILVGIRTGHLGPTVYRSTDFGATWQEAQRPPAFPKAESGAPARVVEQVFFLAPGHADEPGVWYAGASPEGLFRSENAGDTWEPVAGWNDHPNWFDWNGGEEPATPDGSPLHSILIDPRDSKHMYIAGSNGGVFETTDQGGDWAPLNKGSVADFLPDPNPEYGQDPHCVALHPQAPDVLYQQNHCGIYRMDRAEGVWNRIGDNMPREVGDIGFAIALHPRDPATAWVFPMDGTDVWPRTSPNAQPAVYRTCDSGQSWERQDQGLPPENAWYTVYRQALAVDASDPLGVYFGTTGGELWGSSDEGGSWGCIAAHLPQILAVEVAGLAR